MDIKQACGVNGSNRAEGSILWVNRNELNFDQKVMTDA